MCSFELPLEKTLKARIETQTSTLESLTALESGAGQGTTPVAALFSVTLDQPDSIKNRIEELKSSSEESLKSALPFRRWAECANEKERGAVNEVIRNQVRIDRKKLDFLQLPSEQREHLLALYQTNLARSTSLKALADEAISSERRKKSAQEKLEDAENTAAAGGSSSTKDLAGNLAVAQRYLIDLEGSQLKFIEYKVSQTKKYEAIKSELNLLAAPLTSGADPKEIFAAYTRVNEIWRTLVDHIFELYLSSDFLAIPSPPNIQDDSELAPSEGEAGNASHAELRKVLDDISQRVSETRISRIKYIREDKGVISGLLLQAGAIRSRLFNRCREIKCSDLFEISEAMIEDIIRENKVVPFKLFALAISKSIEAKQKTREGLKGWLDLAAQTLYFLIFLILPFIFFYLLRWASRKIDSFRRNLINRSMIDYRRRTNIAIWISRLNPFLPWAGMLLFTYLAEFLLRSTALSELSEVIFYLKLYFGYRISVLFLRSGISEGLTHVNDSALHTSAEKIQNSSFTIARVIFIEIAVLHATSNAVREAYVYTIISHLINYLNVILVFRFCMNWRTEIRENAWETLPKGASERLRRIDNKFLDFLLTPVLLSLIILIRAGRAVYSWCSTLNVVKWIGSEIFKKRLQSDTEARGGSPLLPSDYREYFDFQSLTPHGDFIETSDSHEEELLTLIRSWKAEETDDDAVILHGNRGLGKSTLLKRLSEQLPPETIHSLWVPPKITTRAEFWNFLEVSLSATLKSPDDFLKYDRGLSEKHVIFLDDAQNLFLAELNQLEAYREFLDVLNLPTENVFWCVVLNSKSWSYLKGVFGPEHFYGRNFETRPWSDTELQSLILSRQKRSGYRYRFDKTIKAYAASQEDNDSLRNQAEFQFFRLLWGQSRGNPRSALVYWLTALRYDEESRSIIVGVPQFLDSSLVSNLSDDALFVLAAITKHENLAFREVCMVTGISNSVVKKCLKQMERRELVWKDNSQRVRVSPRAQYLVDFYLLGKNFIHE